MVDRPRPLICTSPWESPSGLRPATLYISDFAVNCIRKVSNGVITTPVGASLLPGYGGDNGPAASSGLFGPAGIALDSAGNLFIAEPDDQRIRKVSAGVITTIAGNGTQGLSGDGGRSL